MPTALALYLYRHPGHKCEFQRDLQSGLCGGNTCRPGGERGGEKVLEEGWLQGGRKPLLFTLSAWATRVVYVPQPAV
jgi:hypothetical protein